MTDIERRSWAEVASSKDLLVTDFLQELVWCEDSPQPWLRVPSFISVMGDAQEAGWKFRIDHPCGGYAQVFHYVDKNKDAWVTLARDIEEGVRW